MSEPPKPSEIARHDFEVVRRGFDQQEVRGFLHEVSALVERLQRTEAELTERVKKAEARLQAVEHPDEGAMLELLGEETTRVLTSARDAAADIRSKAEEAAERIIAEASAQAAQTRSGAVAEADKRLADARAEGDRLLAAARGELERRSQEGEEAADRIRADAEAQAQALRDEARQIRAEAQEEAAALVEAAKAEGRQLVTDAQALRERVLRDLGTRRKKARLQIEQLNAGRERLLQAYEVVRTTVQEATDELHASVTDARLAAAAAGRRIELEPEPSVDELDQELATARLVDLPGEPPPLVRVPEGRLAREQADRPPAAPRPEAAEPSAAPEAPTAPPPPPAPQDIPPAPEAPAVPSAEATIAAERAEPPAPAVTPVGSPPAPPTPPITPSSAPAARRAAVEAPSLAGPDDGAFEPIAVEARAKRATLPPAPTVAEPAAPAGAVVADRAPAAEPEPAPAAEPEPDVDRPRSADAVFARLHAEVDAPDAEGAEEPEKEDAPPANPDAAAFEDRAAATEPIERELSRRLKRTLSDEQNEVLDRLRRTKPAGVDDLLPTDEEHRRRWVDVASAALQDASAAGARWAGGKPGRSSAVADELADTVVLPLRERIERSFASADGNLDDVADRVRALYREWKNQKLPEVAVHHVAAAYARGVYDGVPAGSQVRWVVDPIEAACPDCDDNVLAGAVAKGEDFPTGTACAPAHPGCRCLVLPAVP